MSLYPQALLDTHEELIVDLFAGGGGASSGIEQALGRMVDIAINHDPAAVALHQANHPQTKHLVSDVFEVCPRTVTEGRPVGFLWASPDCTYHSKARGGKPIRSANKKRRSLAWVVTRWAAQVRPRVIAMENVEEFVQWGPLVGKADALRPCPRRRGRSFRKWVNTLRKLGYVVEWRELRACDYGAPTIRKRWFCIARCDGRPIVWPTPTHGPALKPFRTAAECIDWSIPMCSIFATKDEAKAWALKNGQAAPIRPLAENTMRRIARGVKRFVIDNPKPFIVGVGGRQGQSPERSVEVPFQTVTAKADSSVVVPMINPVTHGGDHRMARPANTPLPTITCAQRGEQAFVAPLMVPRYGERDGQAPRAMSIDKPSPVVVPTGNGANLVAANLAAYHSEKGSGDVRGGVLVDPVHTLDTQNRHALVASFLAQNNGGFYEGDGRNLEGPLSTVLTSSRGHHGLIAAHIQRDFGTATGHKADQPLRTVMSGGTKTDLVATFLSKYYGTGDGQPIDEPAATATTKDRMSLVTVMVDGEPFFIADIAMRMLQPRELYRCQGFRDSYIIDRCADGRPLTKSDQVRMCGNSVCPPCAEAIVAANVPELTARAKLRVA